MTKATVATRTRPSPRTATSRDQRPRPLFAAKTAHWAFSFQSTPHGVVQVVPLETCLNGPRAQGTPVRVAFGLLVAVSLLAGCVSAPANQPDASPPRVPTRIGQEPAGPPAPSTSSASTALLPFDAIAVETTDACIPITVGAADFPSQVVGTLFRPEQQENGTRLVLLAPGNGFTREYFDGGIWQYGVANGTTLPRALARAGYAVLTIDRPGMGDSRFDTPQGGMLLTTDEQALILDQVVEALKEGAYGTGDCNAPTPSTIRSPHVIVGGHSFGGLLSLLHATRYGGVDGYVALQIATFGVSSENAQNAVTCQATASPEDYGYAFCPGDPLTGEGPVSESCLNLLTVPERMPMQIRDEVCRNENLRPEGRGAFADLTARFFEINSRVPVAADVPMLMLFAEFDGALNNGADHGDQSNRDNTIQLWSTMCPCADQFEHHTLRDTGHLAAYYTNYEETNERVLSFLAQHDLGPVASL